MRGISENQPQRAIVREFREDSRGETSLVRVYETIHWSLCIQITLFGFIALLLQNRRAST